MPTGFCQICNEVRHCVIDPYGENRCWWCNYTIKELTPRTVQHFSIQVINVRKIQNSCAICGEHSDQALCFKCQKTPSCPNCMEKLVIEIQAQTAKCIKCQFILTASKKKIIQLQQIKKEETGKKPVLAQSRT